MLYWYCLHLSRGFMILLVISLCTKILDTTSVREKHENGNFIKQIMKNKLLLDKDEQRFKENEN